RRRHVRGAAHDYRRAAAGAAAGGGSELMVKAVGLDHVVLNVADVERSIAWYCDELGLEPLRVDEWRRGEVIFPSLRVDEGTIIALGPADRTGQTVAPVCLGIGRGDPRALGASGRFRVVRGPDRRCGARGEGTSLYVLDPDGNLVELRHYA